MNIGNSTGEDEVAVQAVIHSFVRATRLKDIEGMLAFCAPDIVTFDMMPPLRHEGAKAVREIWVKTLAALEPPLEYEINHLKIFVDGKVALAAA